MYYRLIRVNEVALCEIIPVVYGSVLLVSSALTVSPVSEEPPYEDEGEDDVLGRRRPTVRLVTPRHTQVAGGYPRYSNQNEGEIM